jgi:hypothetical protein
MKLTRKTLDLEVHTTLTNKQLEKWRGARIGRIVSVVGQMDKVETVTVIQVGVNTIKQEKKDTKIRTR